MKSNTAAATTAGHPLGIEKPSLALVPSVFVSLVARQSRSDDGSMSVPDQIEKMRAYCETQGWGVAGTYEERDVSGRRPLDRRPGLRQAVADIESGRAHKILTCYFDRFVRSVATRAEVVQRVEAKKGEVLTLDLGRTSNATAAEKLSGTILAAIAEFYADQTGEKLVTSKQRNIDRGIPPFPRTTPAYRRREDGTLEQDPVGAPLVREAIAQRLAGASYAAIAKWINEQEAAVGTEGEEKVVRLTPGGVEQLFASKLLVGEIHFGSFRPNLRAGNSWGGGALIDRSTYRRLNSAKATRGRYAKSERLLARQEILFCETCGSKLSVDIAARGAERKLYAYYRCGNRLCSKPAVVSADAAEEYVRDEAIRLSAGHVGRATSAASVEEARLAKVAAEEKLAKAIRTLAGLGDEEATQETLDLLQADRDAKAEAHDRLALLVGSEVTIRDRAAWDVATLDEKRALVRATIARAVVSPGRGDGRIRVVGREPLA